jgi:hypothetical protein
MLHAAKKLELADAICSAVWLNKYEWLMMGWLIYWNDE